MKSGHFWLLRLEWESLSGHWVGSTREKKYYTIYDIMFIINFNCKYINKSINTHTYNIYNIYIYIFV